MTNPAHDPVALPPDPHRPSMLDRCPLVPTSVQVGEAIWPVNPTDWEQDQVARHWRNALSALGDLTREADALTHRLHNAGRYHTPRAHVTYEHRVSGGGLAYDAMQAEAAMVQLARVIDGIIHRTCEAVLAARDVAADVERERRP